ncbi:isopropylmalate isomerase [Parvularcula dongshanensis]|uniref:Uncharacterized protein n=1 Tax=Parvularcula dongshanensis TaxID=1173995 RepID=A0A840I166_9PROT|nr:isopropylmalate isomerase [Parvularcula dongshanensis]MBB4657938.1 hypothetical protein [Parvularcula dongshanensis]
MTPPLSDLLRCTHAHWSPGIGDPTAGGWITVLAYIAAAALCALVARRREAGERVFWAVLLVLLLALGVNKELDLQSALTAAGKCLAQAQGWYGTRRVVQRAFILGVGALCLGVGAFVLFAMRRSLRAVWPAVAGLAFLLAFVATRAASFHHMDQLIGMRVLGLKLNWVMELSGIGLIAAGAARRLGRERAA